MSNNCGKSFYFEILDDGYVYGGITKPQQKKKRDLGSENWVSLWLLIKKKNG